MTFFTIANCSKTLWLYFLFLSILLLFKQFISIKLNSLYLFYLKNELLLIHFLNEKLRF